MTYTSYQRVLAALEHKEPDRVPIDLGGTAVTGINIHALRRLKDILGIPGEVILRDQVTQLAVTDDATFARLDLDVRCVGPRPPSNPGPARDHGLVDTHYRLTDEWGMGWQMPADGGHYYDLYHSPLAGAETVQDVENFPWPDPLDAARYVGMRAAADQVVYGEQKAFILERMSSGMWEHAMWMRGYEQFFTDMVYNQPVVHAIMSKILEIKMAYWGKALEMMGDYPVIVSEADDLGGQQGLARVAAHVQEPDLALPQEAVRVYQGQGQGQGLHLLPQRRRHLPDPAAADRSRRGHHESLAGQLRGHG